MIVPEIIRTLPLFSGLTEQERDTLLAGGHLRSCARGQTLFQHGEPVAHFYILISGTIQLFRVNAEGNEKTVNVLKSGQTLCESEIMDSCRHHRVTAKAVDDCSIMEFSVTWLKDTAKKHTPFALNLLSLIAQQSHLAEVEAEHQATMSATQLVACFLQRMCVLYDFDPAGFDLPYSKTLIASRLGIELETFSRTLSKLRENGITVKGNSVVIHDLQRIEDFVCGFCSIAEDCPTHQALERKAENSARPKRHSH
ncbi:MAG: Crp/Fnr family transcriptional regulator [Alphaproteobacteria bacterium]|nr:Crp/Fnr family transcriptional regulator [Alphaproteobacteria bacterium]